MRLIPAGLLFLLTVGPASAQMSGTGGGMQNVTPCFGNDQSECGYFILNGTTPFIRVELDVYGPANTTVDARIYAAADQEPYSVEDWGAAVYVDLEEMEAGVHLDATGHGKLIANIWLTALPDANYGWAWKAKLVDTLGGETTYDTEYGYIAIPD